MKRKMLFLSALICASTLIYAGEKDDIKLLETIFQSKNYQSAITQSKEFLSKYPTSKSARDIEERLAKTYYFRKDYENAIDTFSFLIRKYPLKPEEQYEMYYYIAKSYLFLEDEKNAEKWIGQIPKDNLFYERAQYDRGVIYLDRDEYEKAFKTFQNIALTGKELKNSATFNMALTAFNDGQYGMVIDVLNNYVKLRDKNADQSAIDYIYGSSYYKLDKVREATAYFEKVAKENGNTPYGKKAKITLIEIYANSGNIEGVNRIAKEIKGTPEEGEAYTVLGDFYVSIKQYPLAMEYYKNAGLEVNPRAMYGYAYSLYRLDKYAEAKPYFEKLEKTSYYNQAIYYKFAILYKLKDYATILKTREEAKKIVVTQQDNDNVNIIIANAAYELKQYPLAKDYYSRLNLHTPSLDNLYRVITMSGVLNAANDVVERIGDYKRLYPNDMEYRKKIYIAAGDALYNNGKAAAAESLYREYLARDKDQEVISLILSLLVNEKRYSSMGEFLNMQSPSSENTYLRGVAATGMGNYEGADAFYRATLNSLRNNTNSELYMKAKLNQVKNLFLGSAYSAVVSEGNAYLNLQNGKEKDDVVEKIAISLYRLDRFEESRKYFNLLRSIPAKKTEAEFQIGESYVSEKKYSEARSVYSSIYSSTSDEKAKENALYSLGKIAASEKNVEEFKRISNEFLTKYPNSNLRENLLSNFGEVAENITDSKDIIETYSKIYENTNEEHVKQNALEKLTEASIAAKNYSGAETYAVKVTDETKSAKYLSEIYEKLGKGDLAAKNYEKLLSIPEYKEYAAVNLAKYYFVKKDYTKAREFYSLLLEIPNSKIKDLSLFQIATIDELSKKSDTALINYTKVYKEYSSSEYAEEARLKAAQLTEVKNAANAMKIYAEISTTSKVTSYKVFALEKLIFLNLKAKQQKTALTYYTQLKKIDAKAAQKYADFF